MNTELFKKIHDQISQHPETHLQTTWEVNPECGTKRCVAGWAIHLTTGEPVFDWTSGDPSPATRDLADELGTSPEVGDVARELLGLTSRDAYALFQAVTDRQAAEIVHAAAHPDTIVVSASRLLESIGVDEEDYEL